MSLNTTPAPHADDWSATLTARSGYVFDVRPASPNDEVVLAEFFRHVSPEDLRFRFLSAVREVTAAELDAMTHTDHRKTEDFVAIDPETGRIVANAMMAADDSLEAAEVAISIDTEYKGRGIGWSLLEHVAACAKSRGIRKLMSIESRDNHQAIELEREMGFAAKPVDGDATLVLLEAAL